MSLIYLLLPDNFRKKSMYLSLIIPVYNRPGEVKELLDSLTAQTAADFEVIIVEDGSDVKCEDIVKAYSNKLPVTYYYIPNRGPGLARNYGAAKAGGEYLIVLDSDCILPPDYIKSLCKEIQATNADAFGGPDKASDSFTNIQKAINYSMTSFFTTGGIRGGGKKLDKFYPRSFNMGIRRSVFEELGGFSKMRFGEDIDFSIRIYKAGYKVSLFPSAWVYHKRRTDWRKFYKQVYNSGIARINLFMKHPESLKLVHLLPAAFTLGVLLLLAGSVFCVWSLTPLLLYAVIVCTDSAIRNKSLPVGILSIPSSYIQLIGYGCGFLSAVWHRLICKKGGEFSAFQKNFYK
ncbi:Poly-beta-1,6-N-acetyl-D-glucosamine synthase [Bacteroidales bacterium Barb4]|nr:Poly-beta-1,6-N-acetyl-D-glucosamine synthase [Bacteroidales bacterium Barb4]